MNSGRIYYVVGASGSGKDSLLNYARNSLEGNSEIVFAHRYITRPPETEGENHIYLSDREFKIRFKMGLFYMWWNYNNLWYGIGNEVSLWLSQGLNVVVNGSRRYLNQGFVPPGILDVILVQTEPHLLRKRLEQRDRETTAEIDKRLQFATIKSDFPNDKVHIVSNNRTLDEAGQKFVNVLTRS